MSVGEFGFARGILVTLAVGEGHHRLPQRLTPGQLGILRLPLEQVGDEILCRLRMHGPVGDEKCPRPGVEECASKSRCGFRSCTCSRSRIASREYHPIRIEL